MKNTHRTIQIQESHLIVQFNSLFTAGALKMLGNLVESLKAVDRDIGDAVYYWGEFLHKRQSSEASSSSHVGRMFRSNNHAAKTKHNGDNARDYGDKGEVETDNLDIFRRKPNKSGGWVDLNNIIQ